MNIYKQNQKGGAAKAVLILIGLLIVGALAMAFLLPRADSALGRQSFFESFKSRLSNGVVPENKRVKSDADLIRESIIYNRGITIKIYDTAGVVARGIVIGQGGIVATDATAVQSSGTYTARISGRQEAVKVVYLGGNADVAIVQIAGAPSLVARVEGAVQEGQMVAAISGGEKESVAVGIAKKVFTENGTITTSLVGKMMPGSPLINKNGELIGMSTRAASGGNAAVFTNTLAILGALEVVSRNNVAQ